MISRQVDKVAMNNPNRGKVVVVTGASAGVGRAVVREFARQGAHIGLIARGRERLEAARQRLRSGGKALVLPYDVANAEQVEACGREGRAGIGADRYLGQRCNDDNLCAIPRDHPRRIQARHGSHLSGQVYGTMAALKRMHARDRGTIVQVCSALSYRSIPLQSAILRGQACNRGIHRLDPFRADSRRKQCAYHGGDAAGDEHATVQLVPHAPAAASQPVPPIFQPEVAARAIVWAASHKRREVYVGWPTVEAIYGEEIAPSFADRYLAKHGIDGQQTSEPVSPDRPDNLFEPVEGEYSAHGMFDRPGAKSSACRAHMNLTSMNLYGAPRSRCVRRHRAGGLLFAVEEEAVDDAHRVSPEELGSELREGSSRFLKRRRSIMGLSLFSVRDAGRHSAVPDGHFENLPEPRLPGFDTGQGRRLRRGILDLSVSRRVTRAGELRSDCLPRGTGRHNRSKHIPDAAQHGDETSCGCRARR